MTSIAGVRFYRWSKQLANILASELWASQSGQADSATCQGQAVRGDIDDFDGVKQLEEGRACSRAVWNCREMKMDERQMKGDRTRSWALQDASALGH